MSIRHLLCCSILSVAIGLACPLTAATHVRVILDVSGSMRQNDPGQRALLATLLLHDLAAANPTLGDSFEVLPFDRDWTWPGDGAPMPEANRARLRARFEKRAAFAAALDDLHYDSQRTYFYPGLCAAVDDLGASAGGALDARIVVLITDGVPEPATRAEEAARIRREILPAMNAHGIRLFVLAFSPEAVAHRDFLEGLVVGDGTPLGHVSIDPDGTRLVHSMLEIFALGFGYTPDIARELRPRLALDLEAGSQAERVAVVVHSDRPEPPAFDLAPPPGQTLNAPHPPASARRAGGSYRLRWLLSPAVGEHVLTSHDTGWVAVLRPSRLALEILPRHPGGRADVAMAGRPFPLRVRVYAPTGAVGDPGPVALSFRPRGERLHTEDARGDSEVPKTDDYAWSGHRNAPLAGPGTATASGRLYDLVTSFEPNPRAADTPYVGHLEVEARRGAALVGSRLGPYAHRVEIHPLLAIAPFPLTAFASQHALGRRQTGCTRFRLDLAAGTLPAPSRDGYAVRATLVASQDTFAHELRRALVTLDGVALDAEGRAGAEAGAWYRGRTLSEAALLGAHEACVRLGDPTRGDPGQPIELAIRLTLLQAPYDTFAVVEPFTLKVLVAPPAGLGRWRWVLGPTVVAMLLLLGLWIARDRPTLPADLRYALTGPDGATSDHQTMAGSLLARACGRVALRPVSDGEGKVLLWLRPDHEALFLARPARGQALLDESDQACDTGRRGARLEIHRRYRARSAAGDVDLLFFYQDPAKREAG